MLAEKYDLRKILAWILVGVFVLFAAHATYEYLTTGKIIVTTNSPQNYIKITKASGSGNAAAIKQTQGKLSVRLKPGTYNVTVYSKSVSDGRSQSVTAKARKTSRISLNPAKALIPSLVYSQGASSVAADSSQLYFINASTKELMVDGAGGLTRPFTNYSLASVDWVRPGEGVAQSVGNTGNGLYLVSGTALSPLPLPFSPTPGGSLAYSVSTDGTVYVSNGGDIYAGQLGANLTKIYSSTSKSLGLAAGTGRVAVITTTKGASVGSLLVVDDSGKVTKTGFTASQVVWSPDGEHLLASSEGSSYILDGSLHKIDTIPASSSAAFAWQDKTHLLYTNGSQLWAYDLGTKTAYQLSSLPTGASITSVYPATSSSYIYLSVNAGDKNQLYRVSTSGASASKSDAILSALMPDTTGVCTLNYLGFVTPTILVTYPQFETSNDLCLGATQSELRYYKLDPSSFQYSVTPVAANLD
jgi:hypothetical protein